MAANLVVAPDFEAMAQATHALADNFGRLSNLPAADNGAAVLGALQGLQQQMQQQQQHMQQQQQQIQQMHQTQMQQMADMEQRLTTRIAASNTNVTSRLYNSKIFAPDQTLMRLNHVVTNTPINEFPDTVAAIAILPLANVNDLLAALGEDMEGNIAAKRQRIRRAIGLAETAV